MDFEGHQHMEVSNESISLTIRASLDHLRGDKDYTQGNE
jgi:hypothetical protein